MYIKLNVLLYALKVERHNKIKLSVMCMIIV